MIFKKHNKKLQRPDSVSCSDKFTEYIMTQDCPPKGGSSSETEVLKQEIDRLRGVVSSLSFQLGTLRELLKHNTSEEELHRLRENMNHIQICKWIKDEHTYTKAQCMPDGIIENPDDMDPFVKSILVMQLAQELIDKKAIEITAYRMSGLELTSYLMQAIVIKEKEDTK